MTTIESSGYPIHIENDISEPLAAFLSQYDARQIVVLVDENTERDCLPLLPLLRDYATVAIPSGERHKTVETAAVVWNAFFERKLSRKGLLINLGGGVLCDLGGFCASVWNRGTDFIHLPTTLLAMADASVGGKTGVDFHDAKNKIGTFTRPKAVFIDPVFLKTLPKRELMSGFAEMVKHAVVDRAYHEKLKNLPEATPESVAPLIAESVAIKNAIVLQDPYEENVRKILNFGHTIGHALESLSLSADRPLLHGEAVALGMKVEIEVARRKGFLSEETALSYRDTIEKFFDYLEKPAFDFDKMLDFIRQDKKGDGENFLFSLPDEKRGYALDAVVSEEEIGEALQIVQ